MSFCGGTDEKSGLWGAIPAKSISGFVPGELMSLAAPNARAQFYVDTPLGKADGIFFGLLYLMRRKGFDVHKVSEWIEISPVHPQYYQLTIQQKQTLENQIKTALAGVQTAISDYELLFHDWRRYKEYLDYFNKIEEAKKEKDEEKMRENERILRSIFVDQVDVHTGEGVALKLIVPRWPTIIVDFMRLSDEDTDPKKIAKKYEFSEVEGLVLSVKNKLYLKWRDFFYNTVKSRFQHLTELMKARERSIKEYRNMIRPYMARFRHIREMGETTEGQKLLHEQSWWRPATQAVSVDASEYWLWKPFWPAEIHRPPLGGEKENVSISRAPFDRVVRDYLRANWDFIKDEYKTITTSPTGIEPLDKWVIYLQDKMVKHYHKTEGYRSILTARDILEVRNDFVNMYEKMERWNWLLSPYFMTVELNIFRIVFRLADGTEGETLIIGSYPDLALCVKMDTQNVLLLRMLELKLQEKEFLSWITDMMGESVEGKKIEEFLSETHPMIFKSEKMPMPGEYKIPDLKKDYGSFLRKIRFFRPGPYDSVFFERIAALAVKDIAQTAFADTKRYIKSAMGAG